MPDNCDQGQLQSFKSFSQSFNQIAFPSIVESDLKAMRDNINNIFESSQRNSSKIIFYSSFIFQVNILRLRALEMKRRIFFAQSSKEQKDLLKEWEILIQQAYESFT